MFDQQLHLIKVTVLIAVHIYSFSFLPSDTKRYAVGENLHVKLMKSIVIKEYVVIFKLQLPLYAVLMGVNIAPNICTVLFVNEIKISPLIY